MKAIRARGHAALVAALFLSTVPVLQFPLSALGVSAGGMALTKSGNNLVLSFPTTTTNYYGIQTRADFSQPWLNLQAGIAGDGTVKSVTINNPEAQGFFQVSLQPKPAGLTVPQGTAFAYLGHSCGGIQEQVYVTGFDPATGFPVGNAYLSTRCGGSGRGGGYHTTTYSAWISVTWDFAGNVVSSGILTNGASAIPGFIATDAYGDIIYNSGVSAFLVVPVPGAPLGVTAVQSGDAFQVDWTAQGVHPAAVISSTLTATPVNSSNAVLTATVTGSATSGVIPSLQPQTTYQVTVVTTSVGGSSPPSAPVTVTTKSASVAPSAPTGVAAHWSVADPSGSTDTLVATWQAAVPGDSPVDQYRITITGSDGGGTFTQTVSGATLTASFTVDFVPNWSVTVQAHNAVGWGPASTPVSLGGL